MMAQHQAMMSRAFSSHSSLFNESIRSPFDDPFFTGNSLGSSFATSRTLGAPHIPSSTSRSIPVNAIRPENENYYVEEPDDVPMSIENHRVNDQRSSRNFFGLQDFFNSGFPNLDMEIPQGANTFSSSKSYSYTSYSNGRDPPIVKSSSQTAKTINGVTEIARQERDHTGKEVLKVKRIVGDQARLVEQERLNGQTVSTNETLFNLHENQKDEFDNRFRNSMPASERAKLNTISQPTNDQYSRIDYGKR